MRDRANPGWFVYLRHCYHNRRTPDGTDYERILELSTIPNVGFLCWAVVRKEVDGIRYYRFTVHTREAYCLSWGDLRKLLGETASFKDYRGTRLVFHISPLHKDAMVVRDQVATFVESLLGSHGYIERFANGRMAEIVSGVVPTIPRHP